MNIINLDDLLVEDYNDILIKIDQDFYHMLNI